MKCVLSNSGGKDSCLAFARALEARHEVLGLFTTVPQGEDASYFHHLPRELLAAQAEALGIPLTLLSTSPSTYEADFEALLMKYAKRGIQGCIFGDIDEESHRAWGEARCRAAGIKALFPLWQEPREALAHEFLRRGFSAQITVVNEALLAPSFLGETLSVSIFQRMKAAGADVSGEGGEYHSFVTDGPLFHRRVTVRGSSLGNEGPYHWLTLEVLKDEDFTPRREGETP
ncbi:hypothetical protein ABB02_01892 [Clostridiaceae bacterium JG1575]|nr:hypothetical protein ABB02_01892 [Clostridiaceae bacterium JG1575]